MPHFQLAEPAQNQHRTPVRVGNYTKTVKLGEGTGSVHVSVHGAMMSLFSMSASAAEMEERKEENQERVKQNERVKQTDNEAA